MILHFCLSRGLGETALKSSDGTRLNCTEIFCKGLGETALEGSKEDQALH